MASFNHTSILLLLLFCQYNGKAVENKNTGFNQSIFVHSFFVFYVAGGLAGVCPLPTYFMLKE